MDELSVEEIDQHPYEGPGAKSYRDHYDNYLDWILLPIRLGTDLVYPIFPEPGKGFVVPNREYSREHSRELGHTELQQETADEARALVYDTWADLREEQGWFEGWFEQPDLPEEE